MLRRCTKCGIEKPLEEGFSRDSRLKSGRASACRDCKNAAYQRWLAEGDNVKWRRVYRRRYHWANGERTRARWRAWYRQNAARRLAYAREYRAAHGELMREKERGRDRSKWSRAYYRRTREQQRLKFARWRLANLERRAWSEANRRARRRGAGGRITLTEWRALVEHFGRRCLACRRTRVPLTLDHVVPLIAGGPNVIENAQPLCRSCNSRKNRRTIDYRRHGAGVCSC